MDDITRRKTDLELELRTVSGQFATATRECDIINNRNRELTAEIQRLSERLSLKNTECNEMTQSRQEVAGELAHVSERLAATTEEITRMRRVHEDMTADIRTMLIQIERERPRNNPPELNEIGNDDCRLLMATFQNFMDRKERECRQTAAMYHNEFTFDSELPVDL